MHAGGPEGQSRANGGRQRVTAGGGAEGGAMAEAGALPGLGRSGRGPRVYTSGYPGGLDFNKNFLYPKKKYARFMFIFPHLPCYFSC